VRRPLDRAKLLETSRLGEVFLSPGALVDDQQGTDHGSRRRSNSYHPRVRGVQAPQLPNEQEQAQQPGSGDAAQVLPVVPAAHLSPGDPLARERGCGT
jgi:hypothetical protein